MGERSNLVKHVLLSLLVQMLKAIHTSIGVLNHIERMFSKFFSGRYKWNQENALASWENLCFPCEKGGAGFRRLQDICKAFTVNQWWILRSKKSPWSVFILAKYCQRIHPDNKIYYFGESHSWNAMCKLKTSIDHHILLKTIKRDLSLWLDNWTGLGALQ